jgi:hypothetical protein
LKLEVLAATKSTTVVPGRFASPVAGIASEGVAQKKAGPTPLVLHQVVEAHEIHDPLEDIGPQRGKCGHEDEDSAAQD